MQIREERVVRQDGSTGYVYRGDWNLDLGGRVRAGWRDIDLAGFGGRIPVGVVVREPPEVTKVWVGGRLVYDRTAAPA